MKNVFTNWMIMLICGSIAISCQQSGAESIKVFAEKGVVSGRATDAQGKPLKNVSIQLTHKIWSDKKLSARTDINGQYKITLPAEPRGNWNIRAKHQANAYDQTYHFVLDANDNSSFGGARGAIRDFTWKLSGENIDGFYGAHIDVYSPDKNIFLPGVKLVLSPTEKTLVNGTAATVIEKNLQLLNIKYMATDIPLGIYNMQAFYKGRKLKLANALSNELPKQMLEIIFKPNGSFNATENFAEIIISE